MSLERQIVEKVDLYEYYKLYIKPLDKRFASGEYTDDTKVICWFKEHNDINPSMGSIRDKHNKSCRLYHCFGCGRSGNVVRLHQLIELEYHGRRITTNESCLDLANKFGIDIEENIADDDIEKRFDYKYRKLDMLQRRYTEKDFRDNLLKIRKEGVSLDRVNSEVVKMTATVKELYD